VSETTPPVLELRDVAKRYRSAAGGGGQVAALDGVSMSVTAGEFVAVRGPSGCGKTTLLLAAGALLAGDSGQVLLDGQDPYLLNPNQRARLRAGKLGFVFQQFHLVPYLTVLENVLSPCLALAAEDGEARARQLIEHFGLTGRMHHTPGELSIGERQRTALARALLNRPRLLLADEPTGNLDADSARAVLDYLGEFARDGGAVLLVTHDDRAAAYAPRTVRMDKGKIVSGGDK
jgi:ABC-type lipoprotein export system ATPase subunit